MRVVGKSYKNELHVSNCLGVEDIASVSREGRYYVGSGTEMYGERRWMGWGR